jgi:hypothetical protein
MKLRSLAVPMAVGAAALALVAAGCGDDNTSSGSSTGAAGASTGAGTSAAGGPAVTIAQPADGSSVSQPVTLKADLTDFQLNGADVGKPPKTGEGHLHWALDGGKYDFPKYSGANGQLAVKLGVQGKYSPSVTPTITYKNLPAGKHTVEVYLANNDHSNVGPQAETSFTVTGGGGAGAAGKSSVTFVMPAKGSSVSGPLTATVKFTYATPPTATADPPPIPATVKLTGFKLSPSTVGKPPKAGQGHLHFALDGGKYDFPKYSGANGQLAVKLGVQGKYSPSVTPSITYKNLPAGKHTLEVYLANNDHSNVGPEAKTTFTVK